MKVEYTREQAEQLKKDFDSFLIQNQMTGFSFDFESFLDHKFKPSIKVGTWVMEKGGVQATIFVTHVMKTCLRGYGIINGEWHGLKSWFIDDFQPAPDDIVIERITAEVKKRYAVGDEVECLIAREKETIKGLVLNQYQLITSGSFWLPSSDIDGALIMKNGKWAKKIDPNKELKEKIQQLENELEKLKSKL
jgi:hypothetical protein